MTFLSIFFLTIFFGLVTKYRLVVTTFMTITMGYKFCDWSQKIHCDYGNKYCDNGSYIIWLVLKTSSEKMVPEVSFGCKRHVDLSIPSCQNNWSCYGPNITRYSHVRLVDPYTWTGWYSWCTGLCFTLGFLVWKWVFTSSTWTLVN